MCDLGMPCGNPECPNYRPRLNAKELRNIADEDAPQPAKLNPLYFIADSVRDTFNAGGLFRLCDALAASHFFLCGNTPVPPNPKIRSSSSGTYKVVRHSYHEKTVDAISAFRGEKGAWPFVIAIEQPREGFGHHIGSIYDKHFQDLLRSSKRANFPIAFVLGCETGGVSDEVLKVVDGIVDIPMWGINKSLNVIVAASIVGYEVMRQWGL